MTASWAVSRVQPMKLDRRSEVREPIRLPVAFDGGATGLTWDVSPNGLSVEFDGVPEEDSAIAFSITLFDDGRPLHFRAQGQIVWAEPRGERYGIGVQILGLTLETAGRENAPATIH
jgi:hypothetical protein